MELLAGLGTVGNYMEINKKEPVRKPRRQRVKRTNIPGNNIFDTNEPRTAYRDKKNRANIRFKKSLNTLESGIVPETYNLDQEFDRREKNRINNLIKKENLLEGFTANHTTKNCRNEDNDSVFSDDTNMRSLGSLGTCSRNSNGSLDIADHMAFFKKGNMMNDNRRHEKKIIEKSNMNGEPGYMAQFQDLAFDNPANPSASNNVPNKTGEYSNISRIEMERDLALKGEYSNFQNSTDMTYGVVDEQNFVHNNMVPFFKKGIGKGYGPDSAAQDQWNQVKQS